MKFSKLGIVLVAAALAPSASFGGSLADHASAIAKSYEYEASNHPKDAIDALMEAYKADSNNYFINLRLGYLFLSSGITKNAAEHYQKAISASPKSIEARLGLSDVYVAAGKWSELESLSEEILSTEDGHLKATTNLIRSAIMLGKFGRGLAKAEKALERYPINQALLDQRALCLKAMKKDAKAMTAFKELLVLYPTDTTAREGLGNSRVSH